MDPQAAFGALRLVGFPGGEKAPDKWAWLASANQRPTPVFRAPGPPPFYLPSVSMMVRGDNPGKLEKSRFLQGVSLLT